jgi:uncharacterized protein
MEPILATLAGGFLLGLASSVHCACMCGGIASGALFLLRPETPRQRHTAVILMQLGRISTYALAGGAVAGMSSLAVDPHSTEITYKLLQLISAIVLMWAGLSTAGLLPRVAGPGIRVPSMPVLLDPILEPARRHPRLSPLAAGVTWGLTPCPMVYAALFTAMLAGSFVKGALWMAAFGVGTLPGVIGATLGLSALSRTRRGPASELAAGALIAGFGFATLYFDWPVSNVLCLAP